MKKIILMLGLFGLAISAFAASLRDYVCVVRSVIPEDSVKFLEEYRDDLKKAGYSSYAEYIDEYITDGIFGSGFVAYGSDGKPYILTNRHVVREADSVTVQFENSDGSISEYKGLEVVYSDEDVDFAVISVPAGFSRKGLPFAAGNVEDGGDVWSAGFPGLDGKPMWQLGKGNVTNSMARLDELLDSKISTLIQHSAQIDGGNSGGPLLVKTSDSEAGYRVVGINTWKASYRDSTNFAIPASLIQKVFAKSLTPGKGALTMDRRVQQFIESASDEKKKYEPYLKFVSNKMVANYGGDSFLAALSKIPSDERDVLIAIFAYDPIEGIRYSLAWQIWNSLQGKKDAPSISASEITEEGNMMLVTFTVGEKNEITSKWISEHGNWKLLEYSAISSKLEMPKSIVANPYKFRLSGAYTFPISGNSTQGFQIEASYTTNFLYYGFNVSSETNTIPKGKNSSGKENPLKLTNIGVETGLQVPLVFGGKVLFVPMAGVTVGMSMPFFDSGIYFGLQGGAEIGFMFENIAPIVGFNVRYMKYMGRDSSSFSGVVKLGIRVLSW
ncbi:MAG: trypsin-like peptidase domain-containing protein [Treponema sp.]|nr:trypsin-like peptidase domain-containing protein [Treponema sp.]